MKKLLFLFLLTLWLFPTISHAQIDSRCWIDTECYNARKSLYGGDKPTIEDKEAWKKVFRQDDTTEKLCGTRTDAGGANIGFCLPATTAKVKISIGGQTEFTGLAEFISFIYQYGLSVASLLAVLMIIYAGVQWTISGGNTEAISSAQHKIYGAVIGLVLLAAAYTILYTVNPDLVNLRPANAWMINTQKIANPYCSDVKDSLVSKNASNPTGQILTAEQKKAGFSAIASDGWAPTSTAQCGNDYFVQKTGALTCTGTVCPDGNICLNAEGAGNKCYAFNIGGSIRASSFVLGNEIMKAIPLVGNGVQAVFGDGFKFPWLNASTGVLNPSSWGQRSEIFLTAVCNSGDFYRVSNDTFWLGDFSSDEERYMYKVQTTGLDDAEQNSCSSKGGLRGFLLEPCMNEIGDPQCERHFVGKQLINNVEDTDKNYSGVDYGDDPSQVENKLQRCVLKTIPQGTFLKRSEIEAGIKLDIDVSNLHDIDANEHWYNAYKKYLPADTSSC